MQKWKNKIVTKVFTSFVIPGHINRSEIRAWVLFVPRCPDVGSLWHESRIIDCSLISVINLT